MVRVAERRQEMQRVSEQRVTVTRFMVAAIAAVAVCVAGVLGAPSAAAGQTFPFADNNNNGVFDAGVDVDVSADVQSGFVFVSESLVLPAGMKVARTKDGIGLFLSAGKDLTIAADVVAAGEGAGIALSADGGTLKVHEGVRLQAADWISLNAAGDLVIGDGAVVQGSSRESAIFAYAGGGMSIGARVKLQVRGNVDLMASGGDVDFGPGARVLAGSGDVNVSASGNVCMIGAQVSARSTSLFSDHELIELKDSKVSAPRGGGSVTAYVTGSTIDVSGTQFKNIEDSAIVLMGETVIR
jgi:hypothetical protein